MNLFYLLDDINYIGDNFCETKEVLSAIKMFGYILLVAKLIAPIIIIILGTFKFYNAIKDGSSDSTLKNAKSLIVRIFVGIFIFFLPTLLHAVLDSFIPDESKNCEVCLLKPASCDPDDPDSIDTSEDDSSQSSNTSNKANYDNLPVDEANKACLKKCEPLITTGTVVYQNCMNSCLSSTTSTPTEVKKDPNCKIRNASQRYCENGNGCKWDDASKSCDYDNTADNCEYKCNSQYTSGTKAHLDCIDKCSSKGIVDYSKMACLDIPEAACSTQFARCKILIDATDENNGKCVDINYDKCSTNSEANCTGICQWKNGKCQMFDFSLNACDLVTEKDKCTGKCEWSNNSCVIKDCSSYEIFGCPTDYCKQDILNNKCVNK